MNRIEENFNVKRLIRPNAIYYIKDMSVLTFVNSTGIEDYIEILYDFEKDVSKKIDEIENILYDARAEYEALAIKRDDVASDIHENMKKQNDLIGKIRELKE